MANTRVNQEQLEKSLQYIDTVTPSLANYETNPVDVEDDFNSLRSAVNNLLNRDGAGFPAADWYADIATPSALDPGAPRGVSALGVDLHDLERKRVLKRRAMVGVDVTIASAGDLFVILGAGDLPTTTTAAVGNVTTLGTVVAEATAFGTADATDVVAGANTLQPKNLMILTNNATGDVVTRGDGRQIFGLFQSENGTDEFIITATTPDRVQISFVVHNSTNDALELITAGDMDGITFDYAYVERHALEDLPEEAFLGEGFADTGVSASTRQAAYNNQGTAAVVTTSNATLDVGTGFLWELGDATSAALFRITEGSGGGTTNLTVSADVDTYDNNAVDVDFNNGIQVDAGSNTINIGITADQIDFTGNGTITATSASTVTVTAASANATLSTTTSGNIVVTSAGAVDMDATSTVTIDGTGISVDGTASSNFTVTGADLVLSTVTSGELDLTSAGLMDVNAGANLDVDVTGTMDFLSTGAFSIDGTGNSNVTATSGNLQLSTTTSGDVDIFAASRIDMSSGSGEDISISAGRDILALADVYNYDIRDVTTNHFHSRANYTYIGDEAVGDNFVTVNAQYTSGTGTEGGWVKVTSATLETGGTITASTAGVAATSNPELETTGTTGLTVGEIIMVVGANPRSLDGFYEVHASSGTTVELRGIGTDDTQEAFTKRQVVTNGSASGTIYTVSIAVMRNSATGVFEVGSGATSPLTYTTLATGSSSLQQAYETGNTISVTTAEGVITFSNATDATNVLEVSRTFAGAGIGIDLNMGASTTGVGLDVAAAGSGDAVFINNTGTGAALTVQDGGSDVLDVAATGAVTITPTSGTNATITAAGAGIVDINAGAGGVTVDATSGVIALTTTTAGNISMSSAADVVVTATNATVDAASGISLDAASASNFTVNGDDLTLSTTTAGDVIATSAADVVVTAAATVDVNGVNVTVDATSGISLDAAAASNFTVDNASLTLSTTTAGNVVVNSVAAVDVDGASVTVDATGAVSVDAGASSNFTVTSGNLTLSTATSGNVLVSAVNEAEVDARNLTTTMTNIAIAANTAAGVVDTQSSRNYWGDGDEGHLYHTFNSNYTSDTGTTSGQVYVVEASTTTNTTVDTGGFTAGVVGSSDATVETADSAVFAVGDFILITGAARPENNGIYEVLDHTGTTLTIRGPDTGPSANAPFTAQQFVTDTTATGDIQLVTLTVFRVSDTGLGQIAENATNSTSMVYNSVVSGSTLASVVQNVGTSPATQSASFTWEITDGDNLTFQTDLTENLLRIAPDELGTDTVTAINVRITDGTINHQGIGPGPFSFLVRGHDAGGGGAVGGSATFRGGNKSGGSGAGGAVSLLGGTTAATSSAVGGAVTIIGGDSTGGDASGIGGAVTIEGGECLTGDGGDVTVTAGRGSDEGGDLTLEAGRGGGTAGVSFLRGGLASPGSSIAGGAVTVIGGAGDDAASGGAVTIVGGDSGDTGTGATVTLAGAAGGATSGAGGLASVTGGAGTAGNSAGGVGRLLGGNGQGTAAGGDALVQAGNGGATGTGGDAFLVGGTGGATSGNGGDVQITGGIPTDGNGGAITIFANHGIGTNRTGGSVTIDSGDATGTAAAGGFAVTAGQSVTGAAGTVVITAGAGGSTSGAGGQASLVGGAGTAGNSAGGNARILAGAGQGSAAGGGALVQAGTGGATGTGGNAFVTAGAGGATSGNGGEVQITGGAATDGNGGAVSITGQNGTGTNRAGGGITIDSGDATGSASAGAILITGGQSVTGTAGGIIIAGGAGGSTSGSGGVTLLRGGHGTAGNATGGNTGVHGGNGQGSGVGGFAIIRGGEGGATATGGTVEVTGGAGGSTSGNGGIVQISGGTPTVGAGGSVEITGRNALGAGVHAGGSVTLLWGQGVGGGLYGNTDFTTPATAGVTQANPVFRIRNLGSGSGGGETVEMFTGVDVPIHAASTGSLFLRDNGTTGRAYINISAGGSGSTWTELARDGAGGAVTRNFFQDTISNEVTPTNSITASDLTGGVIAVKPGTGFTFNQDAEIYLNGVLLMNGTSNDIEDGAGNTLDVPAGGPTFRVGDVLTIVYYTNSTNTTA